MHIKINSKIFNPKYLPIFNDDTPTQIIFGAAAAGKSYPIMHWVVLWALQGRTIMVCRKVARYIKKSVYPEVSKAMRRLKVSDMFDENKTDMTFVSKVGNGSIIFVGADDPNKLKSITAPKSDAIDIVILEEADQFTSEDFDIIVSRMRGECQWEKKVLMVFNPVSKSSWIYSRFFDAVGWDDEVDMEYKDEHLHITRCLYSDNKFLSKGEIDRIERLKRVNPMFYRVYGEGKFGVVGARVFSAYETRTFTQQSTLRVHAGADFGYSHKSSLVLSRYDNINKIIYVFAEIGVTGKTRTEFGEMIKVKLLDCGLPSNTKIICDSAEPASIRELVKMGINAVPARKGPDSIIKSYDFIKDHLVVIHPSCTQLISEFDTLTYEKDTATGGYKELPVNTGDDMVAGLRYSYSIEYMHSGVIQGRRGLY